MIIDAHLHLSIYEGQAGSLEEALVLLEKQMQELGVCHAIVIPDNIENDPNIADLDTALELLKGKNNFSLLGSPQIIQRGDSEVDKYRLLLKNRSILGLKFFPGHDPYFPTDERCLAFYKMCEQMDVAVVFHTGANSNDASVSKYNDPKYIVEVAKSFPRLKVVITHYFWPKIEYCYKTTKNIQNIYFELAGTADAQVLEDSGGIDLMRKVLKQTVIDRPDKVIFGTDWPMCQVQDHVDLVNSLDVSEEQKKNIFVNNAIKLYKLNIL